MLMNRVESALVNSPPRRWLQLRYETPVLLEIGGRLPAGARALEVGCGPGYGIRLVLERFGADQVDAVVLDPAMLDRARRRLARRHTGRFRLAEGSATDLRSALGADDESYDAVFDFGIIHHIPDWHAALAEIARVLKPGGRFYFDEVTSHALARPSYRLLFDHPTEDRFTADDFLTDVGRHGLTVLGSKTRIRGDYLLGVAHKPSPSHRRT
jgi:ubiquinone/menaquinone biosynthesis C-methylase UbiE